MKTAPSQLLEASRNPASGFGVWGLGFGVWVLEFTVCRLLFIVGCFGSEAQGFWFRAFGSGFSVQRLGFGFQGEGLGAEF